MGRLLKGGLEQEIDYTSLPHHECNWCGRKRTETLGNRLYKFLRGRYELRGRFCSVDCCRTYHELPK